MNLPYIPRLLCLVLGCFFAVYAASAVATALYAPRAVRFAADLAPARAANMLLALRLLPVVLAACAAIGVCMPSYLLFEPDLAVEPAGFLCLALAGSGGALWVLALGRAILAFGRSSSFVRRCRRSGSEVSLDRSHPPALVLETAAPCLALTGIFLPRVVISRGIVNALSEEELSVVLSHESAHRRALDNIKRLFLYMFPGPQTLERAWIAFAEYAADRRAAESDLQQSVALASALVRVARLGGATSLLAPATFFLADASELSARVNRLLAESPCAASAWDRRIVFVTLVLGASIFNAYTFRMVHSILERLML